MSLRTITLFWGLIFFNLCYCAADGKALHFQNPVDTFETHLKTSIVSYYKKYPQEKVFVHTNQPVYCNGETIWYKVYTMAYGKSSTLSKIIYVQLTDTAGNVIRQNKLPLTEGKAHGNIDIGQKVKTGWYRLSAFTSWMMNFGPRSWFHQQIYIRNLGDSIAPTANNETIKKACHISFYPEGGDLIEGNITRIAFKAYSDDGSPVRVSGTVKDKANNSIARFTTVHDGMGEFSIEAYSANMYSAAVKFPDGSLQNVALPTVNAAGVFMQLAQNPNSIEVRLAFAGPKEKFANGVLAAFQSSGQVVTYPLQLDRGVNLFELQKSLFSTGILRLTIFDKDGIPRAERILFVNKHDLQTTTLKTDTLSFSPKGHNSFSISIKDKAGFPAKGNFSVAVTDGDAFEQNDDGQNIFSALLLSPELKGEIHDPGYYFKNESDSLASQLDLVMLTNGWRHFVWKEILNNENNPLKYPVEQSQYIAGKVIDYENQADKNLLKIKLLIMNSDSTKFIGYILPDSTGSFILKNFNHSGFSDLYVQAADKKNRVKNLQVKLLTTLDDSLKQIKSYPFTNQPVPVLSEHYISLVQKEAYYRLQTNTILLKTVTVMEKKTSPTDKLISEHVSLKYESNREFTLDLINNPMLDIGIIDYIRGKFPGLQIIGDGANVVFLYRGGNTLKPPPKPSYGLQAEMGVGADSNSYLPYFYLNEAQVPYVSIKDISLNEIALIRFMPPPVWFAPFNGGNEGAIMIYTKKQSDEIRKMPGMSNYDHYIFNGFSVTREFDAPDYGKLGGTGPPDNRLTLYWNHDLNTDNAGILKFKFYNSSRAKKFRITIQGMDIDGRLWYMEQTVQ